MTLVSFSQYQAPGVYVESQTTSLIAPAGVPTSTVTIVGQARGYQIATETLALNLTPKALKNKGVLPDIDVDTPNPVVTKLDGTVLVEDTDYELVRGAGANDSTTIARVSTSTEIANGDLVTVSYRYSDGSYYAPKYFEDYTSVENIYGPALIGPPGPENPDDSQVYSPLSLAARLAFENGAAAVLLVAVEPTTVDFNLTTRFNQAYAKIASRPEVTLLVPLFTQQAGQTANQYSTSIPGLMSALRTHCVAAAQAGYGQIAFVGLDTNYEDDAVPFDEVAVANSQKRIVLAYPNRLNFFNASLSQSTEIGGPYLAAALAGLQAAQAPNRGLTRLQVFGFSGIPTDLLTEQTVAFKNNLSSSGVSVIEVGRSNRLQVRHGVTTDVTDILTQEISITRSQDALYRLVYEGVESAGLVGEPITNDLTIRVKGILTGLLESAVADLVIAEWVDLQVRQQQQSTGNPTVVECQFTYRPFLPLNYITVTFAMDLTTGTINTDEAVIA